MSASLKARIIRIGNSHGVRLPKVWLDQLALGPEVEMTMEAEHITIRSAQRPRHDWEQAFRAMAAAGDDHLLDPETATQWEAAEWRW